MAAAPVVIDAEFRRVPEAGEPTAEHYAEIIRTETSKSVESVIRIGRTLVKAQATLGNTRWLAMVEADLGWKRSTAYALMKIARHPVLGASNSVGLLPASWGTLEVLAQLDQPNLKAAIDAGAVKPSMTRADAVRLLPERKGARLRREAKSEHEYRPKSGWPTQKGIIQRLAAIRMEIPIAAEAEHLRSTHPEFVAAIEAAIEEANEQFRKTTDAIVIEAMAKASTKPIPWPPPKPVEGGA